MPLFIIVKEHATTTQLRNTGSRKTLMLETRSISGQNRNTFYPTLAYVYPSCPIWPPRIHKNKCGLASAFLRDRPIFPLKTEQSLDLSLHPDLVYRETHNKVVQWSVCITLYSICSSGRCKKTTTQIQMHGFHDNPMIFLSFRCVL